MNKKQTQKEFPGLPEKSALAKKAEEYLAAKDGVEIAKTQEDTVKTELIQEFIIAGQTSVKVAGRTVLYSHMEQDKITTKKQ